MARMNDPVVEDKTDLPMTFYAATKKAVEAMSHSYSHLFKDSDDIVPLLHRVWPVGAPTWRSLQFVDAIENERPIEVYGEGAMKRDFTYVDDLVEAIVRLVGCVPVAGLPVSGRDVIDTLSPVAPWRVVNIGGGQPVELLSFIETIENCLGKRAIRRMLPMQSGDMAATWLTPAS